MKKLALIFCFISVGFAEMSKEEFIQNLNDCLEQKKHCSL